MNRLVPTVIVNLDGIGTVASLVPTVERDIEAKNLNRKVFLIFATEDKLLVDKFREQAEDQQLPFAFRDYSVKHNFDHPWKPQAEKIIRESALILCLVGRRTYESGPVNWEIQKSIELGKPVVALYLVDDEIPIPQALEEHSITPVRWQLVEIIRALEAVSS